MGFVVWMRYCSDLMTCLLALSGAGGGSVDAGDGVTSVSHLNEHQFPAWSTVLLLAMMELQIFRRLYECSHVFSYSSLARMHLAGYLVGLM